MSIFSFFRKKPEVIHEAKNAVVFESLNGNWHYHLGFDNPRKTLCGATHVMISGHLKNWGYLGHLNENYCETCTSLAQDLGIIPIPEQP